MKEDSETEYVNNKYMKNYDKNIESSNLMYLNAKSLY